MEKVVAQKSGFRAEIQGLRGLAIFLIVFYHIWVGKPSGGIDIFIMLSGFFMIPSLAKTVTKSESPKIIDFVSKLARRLIPSALTAVFAITLAMLIIMPSIFWQETLKEIFASALYFENWQLISNSRNYLAAGNSVSPLQHFWSLSIQGQLYLIWFVILLIAIFVLRKLKLAKQNYVFAVILVVFTAAFMYAQVQVNYDQGAAYFNTFARVWEFALGGIVGIIATKLKLNAVVQLLFGWLGIIAILLCGVLLDTRNLFPGYSALWPTLATALVLLNTGDESLNVNRFLKLKPVVYLGNISYPLFLWHWPVLIFFLIQTENEKPGVLGGLFIAAFSLIASALTYKFVEEGFAKKKLFPLMNRRGTLRIAALVCVLVLVLPTSVYAYIGMQQKNSKVSIDDVNYPGARSLLSNFKYEGEKDVDVVPNNFNVKNDVPSVYENDLACIEDSRGLTVIKCEYGKDDSSKTIALVGGSYSAHWLPALQKIIEVREPQWKIVTFLKSSCPMSLGFEKPSTRNTCEKWNEKVLKELSRLKPDLVVSTSTRTGYSNGAEELLPSYEKVWDELQKDELKVLALRDIPRRRYNLSECVAKNGYDSQKCILKKSESLAKLDPTKAIEKYHPNVFFADMTPYLCPETYCKPVVGNVLVHRDHAHMTSTYSATLYPMLWEQINAAFESFNEK